MFNWVDFLTPFFNHLPDIPKYYRFYLDVTKPRVVVTCQYSNSDTLEFRMLNKTVPTGLPDQLQSKGLDAAHKQYLLRTFNSLLNPTSKILFVLKFLCLKLKLILCK